MRKFVSLFAAAALAVGGAALTGCESRTETGTGTGTTGAGTSTGTEMPDTTPPDASVGTTTGPSSTTQPAAP